MTCCYLLNSFIKIFFSGDILIGFWGFVVLFFGMMYNCNLRNMLILPFYEPEINTDGDVLLNNITTIYLPFPHDVLSIFTFYSEEILQPLVQRVRFFHFTTDCTTWTVLASAYVLSTSNKTTIPLIVFSRCKDLMTAPSVCHLMPAETQLTGRASF